jgi:2-methylcitrate dehydratase PrpD
VSAADVASWVSHLEWAHLPEEVRDRAAVTLTNDVGALLGGLPTPASRIAADWARSEGTGAGRLVGADVRVPPAAAAFANGVAGSTLDYDGGHYLGGGIHPGPAVVGSLLTLLDARTYGGDEVLVALTAGYEVAIRLGYLLWPEDRSGQAHTSGTAVAVGAAVAVAKLFRLSQREIQRAIEIAWAHAPIAALQFPMVKESLGWSAATGLSAARLAGAGFKSQPEDAIEFGTDLHPPTPFDRPSEPDPFVGGLGERWCLLDVYFKPYAACRYTHAAADAAIALREASHIAPDEIKKVTVFTHENALFLSEQIPATDDTAQYSFPWVVASALCDGRVGAEHIDPLRLSDPRLLDLASRVEVVHDRSLDGGFPDSYPARVEVTNRGGSVLVEERRGAHGDPRDPMSQAELDDKFERLAARVLGPAEVQALHGALRAMATRSTSDLARLLDRVVVKAT